MRQGVERPLERPGFRESELNCGDQGQIGNGQESPGGLSGTVEASTFLRQGTSTLPEPGRPGRRAACTWMFPAHLG